MILSIPPSRSAIRHSKSVPDIPLSKVVGVLRSYRDNGDDDLFNDHLDWLVNNFAFNDDGAFLIPKDAA